MSRVSEYVENMFCGLPATEEVNNMKWQITESLEDKYAALLMDGRTEDEALGVVVSEFGSMEEIYHSLGYTPGGASTGSMTDPYFQVEYEEFRSKFAVGIGVGVVGCILAVALYTPIENYWGENAATTLFFLLVAASVFCLIYWGIRSGKYDDLKKQMKNQQASMGGQQKTFRKNTSKRTIQKITNAICALIMPVFTLIFFLAGALFGWWHPAWILFPVGGILCAIVGIVGKVIGDLFQD